MVRCPVGGCGHLGDTITNLHCQSQHGMTRAEAIRQFGEPKEVSVLPKVAKWAKEATQSGFVHR